MASSGFYFDADGFVCGTIDLGVLHPWERKGHFEAFVSAFIRN
jgi:hypothetical protein